MRAHGLRATAIAVATALVVPVTAIEAAGAAPSPPGWTNPAATPGDPDPSATLVARGQARPPRAVRDREPPAAEPPAPGINQQDRAISFVQALESPLTRAVAGGCSPLRVSDTRAGDLNGDSILDLVTGWDRDCSVNGGVAVMLGHGDGTYADPVPYSVGGNLEYGPAGLALGDFDGNETLDVVVAAPDRRQVEFFANDGTGVLAAPVFTPINNRPWNLVPADVDGDGLLDVVAVTGEAQGVSVLAGRGDGTFDPPVELATNESPLQIAVAELDGEPGLDLAIPTWHGRRLDLYFNTGGLTFGPRESVNVHGMWLREVWAGDFTGDGLLDLATEGDWPDGGVPGCDGACVGMLVGDGTGTYTLDLSRFLPVEGHGNGNAYYATPPADLDGDGDLDLALPHAGPDSIQVARNDGTGHFEITVWADITGVEPERVVSADNWGPNNGNYRDARSALPADVNDDGLTDIVVSADVPRGNDGGVTILFNQPGSPGRFAAPEILLARTLVDEVGRGGAVVDWNADGDDDLLLAGANGTLLWFEGYGDGTFAPVRTVDVVGGLHNRCFSGKQLYPADFDGDGAMDVFCRGGGWVSPATVFYGDGAGGLEEAVVLEPEVDRGWTDGIVTLADLDGDGDVDIVDPRNAHNWDAWAYYRLALNGGGSREWTYPPTVAAGHGLGQNLQGTAGDFDADGDVDLAAHPNVNEAGQSVQELRVWLNDGTANFAALPTVTVPLPSGAGDSDRARAADLDGDGDDDLVVQNTWSGWWVFRSNGDGTFAAPVLEPGAPYASTIVNDFLVTDVDGDERPDFVGLSYGFGLEILRNNGDGTFEDAPYRFAVGTGTPVAVAAGHLDGNASADLLVVRDTYGVTRHALGAQPVVMLNTSTGIEPGTPPNLSVTAVDAPAALEPGDEATVAYTVHNDGGTATGPWTDQVWLSDDTTWDIGDRLLGTHAHASLGPGADYEGDVTAPFAPLRDGEHHVIVRTDGRGQVAESDEGDNTGTGAPTVLDIPELAVGDAVDVTVADGVARYVAVPAALGQQVRLDFRGPSGGLADVDAVKGAVPIPARDLVMPKPGDADRSLVLPGGAAGTWFLRLLGRDAAGDGTTVTLSASELTFGIVDVSPPRGSNRGEATITIDGDGFGPDSTAALRAGGTVRPAKQVVRSSSRRLHATFDLTGLAAGDYDVEVESGGDTARAAEAFEVVAGRSGRLDVWVDLPGRSRAGFRANTTITFRNGGDTDIETAYARLTPEGMLLAPPGTEDFAFQVVDLVLETRGAPPGVIPPGAIGRIVVPGLVPAATGYAVTVDTFEAGDETPFPAERVLRDARPADLSDEAWALVSGRLLADVGDTTGSFVHSLNAAATESLGFGVDLPTRADRFRHLVERALLTTPGAPLAGRVVTDDGAPTGRVSLGITPGDGEAASQQTWYDGRFALWDAAPGEYQLRFEGPGVAGAPVPVEAPAGDVELTVDGADLRGEVTHLVDGTPVALAGVQLADTDPEAKGALVATTLATNLGRYALLGLPFGEYDLAASDVGFAPTPIEQVELTGTGGTTRHLGVAAGAVIRGVVHDNLGRPVAGAFVAADLQGHALGNGLARSGADGSFAVTELSPGTYDLAAYGRVPVPAAVEDVPVAAAGETAGIELTVDAGATVSGTVTDARTGEPVEGAYVAVGGGGFTVETGPGGGYVLEGVPSGAQPLEVWADGYLDHESELVLGAGTWKVQPVALDPGGVVSGRVEDGDGVPLESVAVGVTPVGGGSTAWDTTDADGRFEFRALPPGDHTVSVADGAATRDVAVATGVPVDELVVLAVGRITGRIVDAAGDPAEGTVAISRDGRVLAVAPTDGAGGFSVAVLDAGPYDLVASGHGGFATAAGVTGVPGAETDVGDFALGEGALHVDVTGPDGPVEGATVLVDQPGAAAPPPNPLGGGTDAAGALDQAGLLAGEYRVTVRADGLAPARTDVHVAAETADLDVPLDAGHTLDGRVLDGHGDPVAAAEVHAVEHALGAAPPAVTAGDGTFAIGGLASGTYDLVVTAPGQPSFAQRDVVVGGDTAAGDLAFPLAGASIGGTVAGESGAPLPVAMVTASDARGVLVGSAVVAPTGNTFEIGPLGDVGPVTLSVVPLAGLPWDRPGTVEAPAAGVALAVPASGLLPVTPATEPGDAGGVTHRVSFARGRAAAGPSDGGPAVGLSLAIFDREFHIPSPSQLLDAWIGFPEEPQRDWRDPVAENRLRMLRSRISWRCQDQVNAYIRAVRYSNLKDQQFFELERAYHLWWRDIRDAIAPALLTGIKLASSLVATFSVLKNSAAAATQIASEFPRQAAFLRRFGDLDHVVERIQTVIPIITGVAETVITGIDNITQWVKNGRPQTVYWEAGSFWLKPFALSLLETAADMDLSLEALQAAGVVGAMKDMAKAGLAAVAQLIEILNDIIGFSEELYQTLTTLSSMHDRREDSKRLYELGVSRFVGAVDHLARIANPNARCDPPDPTRRWRTWGSAVVSGDPNEIYGPGGAGDARWLPEESRLGYTIEFENLGDGSEVVPPGQSKATAPAAIVVITEQLDPDVDRSSFEFGEFGFGNDPAGASGYPGLRFTPPPGAQSFSEERTVTVPVYGTEEDPVEVVVRATAGFDPDTGVATWRIETLDPATGETPVDGLVGFLPPEPVDDEGAGQGFAAYSVAAEPGLATGTEISAQASIVFDANDEIETNTWTNAIDAGVPSAAAAPLPATTTAPFRVAWTGADDAGGPAGSGVDRFDVFVSVDGGPLELWLSDTARTSRRFAGVVGHRYGFAVRAADAVGHVERVPARAEARTRVVETPPVSSTTTTTAAPPTTTTTSTPPVGGQGGAGRRGLVLAAADGGVFGLGGASFHGSLVGRRLAGRPVAVLRTPSGRGYYVVGADGGVFAFGDAVFRGSLAGRRLAAPIVDAALSRSGRGYLLVGADGGVFAFGDAAFRGSLARRRLAAPIVAVMRSRSGRGYLLVGADGGVFAFGDAVFRGSLAGRRLAAPIIDAARARRGGYWLVGLDGGVFAFGGAPFRGSLGGLRLAAPVKAITPTRSGRGYHLAAADGGTFAFGDAAWAGSLAGTGLTAPVTDAAT